MIKKIITIFLILMPSLGSTQDIADNLTSMAERDALIKNITNDINNSIDQKKIRPRYGVKLSRMPLTVGTPNFSGIFNRFDESAKFNIWRENIDGKLRLFIQVQPISKSFFFCPGGNSFSIIQNARDLGEAFRATRGNDDSVCQDLSITEVFLVDQWSIYTNFQEENAFVISYANKSSFFSGSINVAGANGNIEQPPASNAVDVFNSSTGELTLPNVKVGNDNYSAILIFQGNDLFRLKSAIKK